MKLLLSGSLLISAATAQSLIESLSFGYENRLSPHTDSIPGWHLSGENNTPQILSNKLILTPPYPGNTRGAIWTADIIESRDWSIDFEFRANGPERGSGNLQIWMVKNGESAVGDSSIYTVGKFDGLALTIDPHGGRGGSIRGFLNDDTVDYKTHSSVDSLAFGHCDYSYRNLGRPSAIQLQQSSSTFSVTVDGKLCFSTDKVIVPDGNNIGITAATPVSPDSFEIFKTIVHYTPPQPAEPSQPVSSERSTVSDNPPVSNDLSVEQQFASLHERLQALHQTSDQIWHEIQAVNQNIQNLANQQSSSPPPTQDSPQMGNIESRLGKLEDALRILQQSIDSNNYHEKFVQLQRALENSHVTLTENLHGSLSSLILAATPRMGLFIFMVLAFQAIVVIGYIVYMRRRNNMPKKYL